MSTDKGGGGPPDKTQTLNTAYFSTPADWDVAVSALYQEGYVYGFTVLGWVTFVGYKNQ